MEKTQPRATRRPCAGVQLVRPTTARCDHGIDQPSGNAGGAVITAAVNHDDLYLLAAATRQATENAADAGGFVQGGDDDA